ncbi:MAG: hypothetical protein GY694_17940 [Gammaproteobacteria bacterium]|nr:hypothetical protein [Gammaproteobacteria bacterium]
MKKIITILTTATFFAIACSLIDQVVWNNEFYWINAFIGFITGGILALLSKTSVSDHNHSTTA